MKKIKDKEKKEKEYDRTRLIGKVYGNLTVTDYAGIDGRYHYWLVYDSKLNKKRIMLEDKLTEDVVMEDTKETVWKLESQQCHFH